MSNFLEIKNFGLWCQGQDINSTGCPQTRIKSFYQMFFQSTWHTLFQVVWGTKYPCILIFCM